MRRGGAAPAAVDDGGRRRRAGSRPILRFNPALSLPLDAAPAPLPAVAWEDGWRHSAEGTTRLERMEVGVESTTYSAKPPLDQGRTGSSVGVVGLGRPGGGVDESQMDGGVVCRVAAGGVTNLPSTKLEWLGGV